MTQYMVVLGLALSISGMPTASALDFQTLTFERNGTQTWVAPGGMIIPADESIANWISGMRFGRTTCDTKAFHTSHVGTHAYVIYDLKNCR